MKTTEIFNKPKILRIAKRILKHRNICSNCLGRQFAQVSTGLTNKERGKILRKLLKAKEPKKCTICNDLFKNLNKWSDEAIKKLKGIEFETFVVGTKLSSDLIIREENLWEEIGINFCESIRAEINRELGKLIENKTKKIVNEINPNIVIILNLKKNIVEIKISSLFIYGEYKKLIRGIPQTKWDKYKESVEDIIAKPIMRVTKGFGHSMHACVSSDTKVLLEDGYLVPISRLENQWKNKKVSTYDCDNKNLRSSKIIDFIKLSPKKMNFKVFRIVTKETGRRIIATGDHEFYTPNGMMPVSKLKQNDRLAVYPIKSVDEKPIKNNIILKEIDIKKTIERYYPNYDKEKVIIELKQRGLLPLSTKNDKLLILIRILGFLFGDGHVRCIKNRDVSLDFYGKEEDLKEIKKDLNLLGFSHSPIRLQKSYSEVRDYYGKKRVISGTGKKFISYSRSLWFLIAALGAPTGNKVINDISIPNWIKKAEKKFKCEFLASLFGCEMDKPRLDKRKYNRKSFNTPRFSINKVENNLQNGLEFINDIRKMLKEFGIETLKPRLTPYATRKDGYKSIKICLDFSNRFENLLNLYGRIGFRYCKEREIFSKYVIEYFSMKKFVVDKRKELFKKALKLKNKGLDLSEIHKELDSKFIKKEDLWLWIHKKIKQENIKVPNDFPDFKTWLRGAKKSLNNGLVWETIKSVEENDKDSYVFDITVNPTHTFFANGFLVSNCGREDIDARCLDYRPFIFEVKEPLKRKIDLKKIAKEVNKTKKVEIRNLKFSNKKAIIKLKVSKYDKTYRVIAVFAQPVKNINLVKKICGVIKQKTPTRVLHRRADKVRQRKVKAIEWKKINARKFEFKIMGEAGLYIKELITGDNGRTKPSISEILKNQAKVEEIDVIKIWR